MIINNPDMELSHQTWNGKLEDANTKVNIFIRTTKPEYVPQRVWNISTDSECRLAFGRGFIGWEDFTETQLCVFNVGVLLPKSNVVIV